MDTHNAIVVKAADIEHVLREKLAFLPGSRDRDGRSLLLFRPKDAVSNPDHLRILLHYLHSIAKNGDAGYTVVLDMRGKVKWDSVKPLVKALNNAVERGVMSVPLVLIIRPDKFLEKQKAQFAHGISRAEVQTVTVESLSRYFDVSQLPRDFGGHFAFDYDDWLDTRLALEGWIWRVSEWMRSLEECRRRMHEEGVPVCVQTAETAIAVHTQTQKRILAVPMDQLEREEMQMEEKIRAGQQRNGDLDAAIPHMRSVISSLLQLKNDVFARWQRRREELREAHQSKLLERDVEGVLVWIKCKGDEVLREMENVGDTLQDTEEKIKELHEVEETLKNMDLSVGHVQSTAARTRSTGRHVLKVGEEHSRLIDLLNKRRHLLTTAAAFERAEKKYTEEWSGCRGTRVRDLPSRDSHVVKEALLHNEELWKQADSAYLNALEKGNKLSHAWNAAECTAGERKTKERVARLSTAHRIVNEEFKEAKKELSMMNAFDAFEEDLRRVFTWLDDHGEPYLKKNRSIGDNRGEAVHLRNNHIQFREIARGTSENAKKLFEVGEECLKSGLFEEDLIRSCLTQLHARISSFESAVEGRLKVLNQATLFFTHHEELLTWYDEMERKYSVLLVHSSVSQCEHDNRQWTLESDGTGQAYTTTVGEGTQLVHAMQEEAARHGSALRTSYVERLHLMLGEIDERNAHLNALWNRQRPALQWALKFAVTLNDIQDLVEQMASWQDDMHTLVQSDAFFDSAEKVIPFHADNQVKVRRAVEEIKTRVNELRQLAGHHGLESLCTVEGEPVDEVLNERIVQLHAMEDAVAKSAVETAKRLEAAKKALAFHSYCNEFMAACEACEKRVHSLSSAHPTNLNDALRMVYDITECQKEFEARERDRATSYRFKFDEVLRNPAIPRNKVVDWNHEVNRSLQRLNLLFSERLRAVKAGADFYKTYNTVSPILDHLTRDYSSSSTSHDWCATCQGTPEKKLESMTEQLKAHVGVRDKFQTGCTYTQKTSDLFLKYLNRCPSSSQQRECVHHVQKLRAAVRQQQAHILELWARKKKELDRCHQWVLFECSRVDITGWLKKEAAESLRAIASATGTHRNELLNALTVKMKERRSEIRTLLNTGECMMGEGERHAEDIRKTMQMVTDAFEEMAGKLNKETDKKEELSLDRRSDQTVEGKMPQTPKETTKPSEPMKELLNTERVYIDDLRKCIDVYLNAFDRFEAEDKIPPPLKGRRSEIFGNIEDIFTFHADTFVGELEKYEKEPELVGMSFTVYVGALSDLYTSYCAHKDLNKNLLHQGEAVSFFESIREAHHLETKDSMDSLLIKPVQRVTRYALLMGQLCKNNDSIKEALEVVSNIPKKANDICHLNYIDSKDKEKIMHAGALVTQDALNVWEPKLIKGKGKERQVFLFESALVFTKKVMEAGNRTRYLLKGKPIQMGDITSIAEHLEGDKCRLALRLGDLAASENNRIELRAASESAKVAFVKQLRNCMHEEQLVSLRLRLDTSGLERNGLDYDEGSSLASHDTNRNSIQSSSSTDQRGSEMGEDRLDTLHPDAAPDRPSIVSPSASSKRKSLRRIFSHSSRPSASSPQSRDEPSASSSGCVLSAPLDVDNEEAEEEAAMEEGLPPPMEEIATNEKEEEKDDETPPENDEKKDDKTPEEVARFKRQYVLMELVETEKDYIKDLGSVVEGYMAEMQAKDLPEDLQGKDKIIFANIAQIHEFHKTCFLKEVEQSLENYEASASPFVKYERRLHTLYVKYCQNKPKSDYLVAQDAFEAYFTETKARLGHKIALCDLLIKPVQRIMKYQLLLKDVLKFTERAHDSTVVLKKALDVMHVVPKACDDMMQVGRLQNFDGNLNAQGKLLHQGTVLLSEQGGGGPSGAGKSKERRIFLFEQSAIIADCIMPKKEFGNPTYIFKNQIMVNKMQLEASVADSPLAFVITTPDQSNSFLAQCTTEDEKEEWIRKISMQLDQQKTLLAALVDPKRYQSQLVGAVNAVSLDGEDKKKSASSSTFFSRFKAAPSGGSASAPSSSTPKPESPKHSAKGKSSLFNFGKKSGGKQQSPTTPPVPSLPAVVAIPYSKLREGELDCEEGDIVEVVHSDGLYAMVERGSEAAGLVPTSCLAIHTLQGENAAEQIEYRREWLHRVDDQPVAEGTSPLSPPHIVLGSSSTAVSPSSDTSLRPIIINALEDSSFKEGSSATLRVQIFSRAPFNVTWRGPAVWERRVELEAENSISKLTIRSVKASDGGFYSLIAASEHGTATCHSLLTVVSKPPPPTDLRYRLLSPFCTRLSWSAVEDTLYLIEYRREGMETFRVAMNGIAVEKVTIRGFRPAVYEVRVVAYNKFWRSDPSTPIRLDLQLSHLEGKGSQASSSSSSTPLTQSTQF